MNHVPKAPRVAIACGGTGGHIFPGLAVAEQLIQRGCAVTVLLSPKEVDQQAVKKISNMEIAVLPAVGLGQKGRLAFLRGFVKSFLVARKLFREQRPEAVLAMGGFTAAPPVLAARLCGIPTFLHESNTIPGRANRFLSRFVQQAFVGFPEAASRLHAKQVTVTGTPVRPQFQPRSSAECRTALGLQPDRPVVLVMGGSQGASGINDLVVATLSIVHQRAPQVQWLHLTGNKHSLPVSHAHQTLHGGHLAVVYEFLAEMELALGAATVAVSRAGASSLAELAAMRVPSVLIPYPTATDDHQLRNATAFASSGAASVLEQKTATPEKFADALITLLNDAASLESMRLALAQWHQPDAAARIAESILNHVAMRLKLRPARVKIADTVPGALMVCQGGKEQPWSGFKVIPEPQPAPSPRATSKPSAVLFSDQATA